MRVHVPAPTLLSRVTVDQDLDMTGYKVVNAGNVDLQTNGVIINDLLLKRQSSQEIRVRTGTDTSYKDIRSRGLIADSKVCIYNSAGKITAYNANDAYTIIEAYKNGVGLAEIARLTGAATPTFDLTRGRLAGDLDAQYKTIYDRALAVGTVEIHRNDTESGKATTSYSKAKEIVVGVSGEYKVKFDLKNNNAGDTVYGKIYKNGSPHGTERTTDQTTYTTFTEDLSFAKGDLLQVYLKTSVGATDVFVRNLRLHVAECEQYVNTKE